MRRKIIIDKVASQSKGIHTRALQVSGLAAAAMLLGLVLAPQARTQTPAPSQDAKTAAAANLTKYCGGCHNAKAKTAGVVIDTSFANINGDAETLEKVVRQLRAKSMPPPNLPRPDAPTYTAMASYLEGELDRNAALHPNAGKIPNLHRLTRTEYANSVRDLLGLDHLPKEMDYTLLLPADNASGGFDNIADLLYISPATMDRYLDAAMKISRLAVGDPTMPLMVNIYRMPLEKPQELQLEDMPFGTRGGFETETYFPMDAEYVAQVNMAGFGGNPGGLEINIDGERVASVEPTPAAQAGGRGGRGGGRGRGPAAPPEFRFAVKAGPHLLGVTFAEITQAIPEDTLKPRARTRGTLPAIESVTLRGPYNISGPGSTPSRQKIFTCTPANQSQEATCARQIVANLVRQAYRRPATADDIAEVMEFYTNGRQGASFDKGIQAAIERILVSPYFLYRIERDPAGAAPGTTYRVGDLELASRLSFFIWSSGPDEELLKAAADNKLHEPAVMKAHVERMLKDPRAESLVNNFAEQWLYLRDVDIKAPDLFVFADFEENLRESFKRETELFLASILLDPNRSVIDLMTDNHTFVNERLAQHYGIPGVRGARFRKVELPKDSPRAGLLGQGSILMLTSYSTRTSPVLRGKYVLENLLASPPPPPPPNVPSLKTEGNNPEEVLTLRKAMELHRANPACATCHARMDPIGFAMENFDAVGRWRDDAQGQAIETKSSLADGTVVDGIAGVKQLVLKDPARFVTAVTEKLMMYGIGRNVQYYDAPSIRKVVRDAATNNYKFADLVTGVALSSSFQSRTVQAADPAQSAEVR